MLSFLPSVFSWHQPVKIGLNSICFWAVIAVLVWNPVLKGKLLSFLAEYPPLALNYNGWEESWCLIKSFMIPNIFSSYIYKTFLRQM